MRAKKSSKRYGGLPELDEDEDYWLVQRAVLEVIPEKKSIQFDVISKRILKRFGAMWHCVKNSTIYQDGLGGLVLGHDNDEFLRALLADLVEKEYVSEKITDYGNKVLYRRLSMAAIGPPDDHKIRSWFGVIFDISILDQIAREV
jgi:hypothetical protein